MTPTEIQKLQGLAEQGKQRDLAIYAKHVHRQNEILQEIDELRSQVQNCDMTADLSVSTKWKLWAEQKLNTLKSDASAIEVEKEHARNVALRSSAKVQSLELLLKDAKKVQLATNRRRAEQNGVPPDA